MKPVYRSHSVALPAIYLISTLVWMPVAPVRALPVATPNCGVDSAWSRAYLMGLDVAVTDLEAICRRFATPTVSLLDVGDMANRMGLPVEGIEIPMSDCLTQRRYGILWLREPDHFVAYVGAENGWARLLRRPDLPVELMPLPELERRYGGRMLVAAKPVPHPDRAGVVATPEHVNLPDWSTATVAVNLRNIGRDTLTFTVESSTCGCTQVQPAGSLVEPGRSTDLTLTFTGQTTTRVSHVVIRTNDPNRPRVLVSGSRPPEAPMPIIRPRQVVWRQKPGPAFNETFLTVFLPAGSSLLWADASQPWIEVTVADIRRVDGGKRVILNVSGRSPMLRVERLHEEIRLTVQGLAEPLIVPLTVVQVPEVVLTPSELFLGRLSPEATHRCQVYVACPLEVLKMLHVRSTDESIRVESHASLPNGITIHLLVHPRATGLLAASVRFEWSSAGQTYSVDLPVIAWVE